MRRAMTFQVDMGIDGAGKPVFVDLEELLATHLVDAGEDVRKQWFFGATAPFQSICDGLVTTHVPPVAVQVPGSAIKLTGSCAVNSDPGLSVCARLPELVKRASTAMMLPVPVQAAGSVSFNETPA